MMPLEHVARCPRPTEVCAVAGSPETRAMDWPRRPLEAFEPKLDPDMPVKVPPLPRPRAKPKPPRWRCDHCGRLDDDPSDLCEPVRLS